MNKNMESKMTAFWYAMRGSVAPGDYITATVLASEVKKHFQGQTDDETSD